jgi:hypothetical protein
MRDFPSFWVVEVRGRFLAMIGHATARQAQHQDAAIAA